MLNKGLKGNTPPDGGSTFSPPPLSFDSSTPPLPMESSTFNSPPPFDHSNTPPPPPPPPEVFSSILCSSPLPVHKSTCTHSLPLEEACTWSPRPSSDEHGTFSPPSPPPEDQSTFSQSDNNTPSSSNTEDSDTLFFIKELPQQPCFFFISAEDWAYLRKRQNRHQFKTSQWTHVISKGIRTVHSYCSFAFKRHSVKPIMSSRDTPLFTCLGYCMFDDCPVCVEVKVDNESSLKAMVTFQGDCVRHSRDELKRRPVRGTQREVIATTLTSKLPRSLYLEKLDELDDTVEDSGCRDEVPTTGVLKTISWSARKKQRRDKNEMISLQKIIEDELQEGGGLIQKVIQHPKGVMLWSLVTIQLFAERAKEDIVYVDATGSIIKKEKGESAPFYIYEIVVRHPLKGRSPVPVATFVTCDHTTSSVSYFLGSFMTDCIRCHGRHIKKRCVMYICDGSLVLMESISQNCCGMSLRELLSMYFDIVTGQGQKEAYHIPILHRCLSHIMKNAKDLCRKQ